MEMITGDGGIKKTGSTAVFHQETITVPKLELDGMFEKKFAARQEYYSPGTNHAMVPVLAVQRSKRTTVRMTAWLDLMKSQTNKMIQTLISTRTYKTALLIVTQV